MSNGLHNIQFKDSPCELCVQVCEHLQNGRTYNRACSLHQGRGFVNAGLLSSHGPRKFRNACSVTTEENFDEEKCHTGQFKSQCLALYFLKTPLPGTVCFKKKSSGRPGIPREFLSLLVCVFHTERARSCRVRSAGSAAVFFFPFSFFSFFFSCRERFKRSQ